MNSSACSATFETIDLQLKDANGTESKLNDFAHIPWEDTPDPPKPWKERNSFRNCWWRIPGIFQGYVGKILEKWSRMWLIVRCFYFSCSCIVGMDRCNLYWRKVHESGAFFSICVLSANLWISWISLRYITLFEARNALFYLPEMVCSLKVGSQLVWDAMVAWFLRKAGQQNLETTQGHKSNSTWHPPKNDSWNRGDFPVLLLTPPPKINECPPKKGRNVKPSNHWFSGKQTGV